MGLIKAAFGSAGGVLADQWKEFFYCDALDKNTLVVRDRRRLPAAPPTPRGTTTSFPTAPASPWRTDSA